jgi:hypothetical protein
VTWEHDTAVRWDPMPVGNHQLSSIQTCASVHPQLAGSAPNLVGAVRRRRRRPGSRQHLRTDPGTGALGTGVRGDSSSVSRAKPAAVRFYFDADMFGLANLSSRERVDFTFPGDPGGRIKKRERHPVRSKPQPVRAPSGVPPWRTRLAHYH